MGYENKIQNELDKHEDQWNDAVRPDVVRFGKQADKRIRELERAISVLARSNSDWAFNVSNDDEILIDRLLRDIDRT